MIIQLIEKINKNKKLNLEQVFLIIGISFIHFIISVPFSFYKGTCLCINDIKAMWQPPGIVFGIVWSCLYALLGIISLMAFKYRELNINCRTKILKTSIIEAIMQGAWLLSYGRYIDNPSTYDRFEFQYFLSCAIILIIASYAWFVRMPNLRKCSFKMFIIYLPYCFWITFASILNLQILYLSQIKS